MLFTPSLRKKAAFFPDKFPELYLDNTSLKFVESYRYLGIELHQILSLDIENDIKKVRPVLYTLGKLRYCISESVSVAIFKTYIFPLLENGLYVLDGYCQNQVARLQKIQNGASRVCFLTNCTQPAFPLHVKSNQLSLALHRTACLLNYLNLKLVKGDKTFALDSKKENRMRGGLKLRMEFPRYEGFVQSLSY